MGREPTRKQAVGVRTFRVRVDLRAVARNLSREEGHKVSEAEVLRLLADGGFVQEGDGWIVREPDLGLLDPSEVLTIEPVPPQKDQPRSN